MYPAVYLMVFATAAPPSTVELEELDGVDATSLVSSTGDGVDDLFILTKIIL